MTNRLSRIVGLTRNLLDTSIKFTNKYSNKKENSILNQTQQLATNNNMMIKNLITVETLDPAQYKSWTKEQVYSLLCTADDKAGAGLTDDEVKPLYTAGFSGRFLANIVTNIQEEGKKEAIEQLEKKYTKAGIPLTVELLTTLQTVVNWVDNLLKTRLYHLWSDEQKKGLNKEKLFIKVELKQFDPLSSLLRDHRPRASPFPLVESTVHVPFKTKPVFINEVSKSFENLSNANDKQNVFIPFLACGPGTGKSRTLQEAYPLTEYGIQNKENSCIILISYGNGWSINDTEYETLSYEEGLCMRIVFSYLDLPATFSDFRTPSNYSNFKGCKLVQTLNSLAEHYNYSKKKDAHEKVIFYIAIDEFTELQNFSYNRDSYTGETKTYLHGIISTLGNFITSHNTKTNITLLPMFAGLDYLSFTMASSPYGSLCISPYIYSSEDLYSIVKQHIPHLISNNELWRRILCINNHARSLEYFIEELKAYGTGDLSEAKIVSSFNQAKSKVLSKYNKIQLDNEIAKQILAYVITEKKTITTRTIVPGGPTFKQLEDWGYIRLIPSKKNPNEVLCTCSLFILEKCWENIEESEIFQNYFNELLNASTIDRKFERFNVLFDIILNQCFIFLGKEIINISERFRGITNTEIADALFDLKTFPTKLQKKKLSEVRLQGPKNTMVQFADHKSNFFDRCYNAYYTKNHLFTFLWQERGSRTSNRTFGNKDVSEIMNNHFTKKDITSISLGVVMTTRPVTRRITTTRTIGIIGREGLEEYYGSFIFKINFCSGMLTIPFSINQTFIDNIDIKKYSYNLAFLLGIDDRRARNYTTKLLKVITLTKWKIWN